MAVSSFQVAFKNSFFLLEAVVLAQRGTHSFLFDSKRLISQTRKVLGAGHAPCPAPQPFWDPTLIASRAPPELADTSSVLPRRPACSAPTASPELHTPAWPSHCSHPCLVLLACVPHCSTGKQLQTFGQGPLFLIESLLWASSGWMQDGRMDEWGSDGWVTCTLVFVEFVKAERKYRDPFS